MRRRTFMQAGAAALAAPKGSKAGESKTIQKRAIPRSGEQLPVIGLGTWQTFDVGSDAQIRQQLSEVLRTLVESGGSVVDSSPMYGRSESVVGALAEQAGVADKLFYATKVWTDGRAAGITQMERSMQRMRVKNMDLMQVHNLRDAELHLETLSQWKEQGRIRYTGITHYHSGGYARMAELMRQYPLDFIQINYSMSSREAEDEILPLAQERKMAVLINRPYEGGSLFSAVRGRDLPAWVTELGYQSWGNVFLKFILANPAVTCVIPGTSKLRHLQDNLRAGLGAVPDAAERRKLLSLLKP